MELKELIALPSATIIDVSTAAEYELGHIEKAINIPIDSLPKNIEKMKQMSKPIIVYCRTGGCSQSAAIELRSYGINEVYNGGSLGDMKVIKSADCGCGINIK